MSKDATSDFDALFTEVDEMLNLGMKLTNEHIPAEGDARQKLTQQLVSVSDSLHELGKQRVKEQAALQRVMDKAEAWDDKDKKFDPKKELQAILDETMEGDVTQDQVGANGKDITKK